MIPRTTLCAAALVLSVMAGTAAAEPGPIGKWLMNQPVSLWDHGMREAQRDAGRAAEWAGENIGHHELGWALYDWDNNEIDLTMTVWGYHADLSHENCNKVRRDFIGYVASTLNLRDEDRARSNLRNRIHYWFSHEGYENKERDKDLGEKMARIIFVKVILRGTDKAISCRDRIMKFDAPSKPSAFDAQKGK